MEAVVKKEMIIDKESCNRIVIKNIFLFLIGQLISLLGSSIYSFVMGLYILQRTGSGLSFSLTIALGTLPRVIFGPVSGVVADRIDRKKMVVFLDLLSAFVGIIIYALSIFDDLRLIYIYISSFLLATCNVFFETPLEASIPNLVDEKRLVRINSLSQVVVSISTISGPFIGGLIFALIDTKIFLLVNSVSFIFSAVAKIFIDFKAKEKIYGFDEKNDNVKNKNNFLGDLKQGIAYIISQKWLVILGSFAVLLNMFYIISISVAVPFIAVHVWGFSSKQVGILNMVFPLGMLIGSIAIYWLPQSKNNYKRMIRCLYISSLGILFTGILTCDRMINLNKINYLIILAIVYLILAISSVSFNIPLNVLLQRHVPNEMLGRVRSVILTFVMGLSPLGAIIGGVLLDVVYPWLLPMVCGSIMLVLIFIMSRVKELKSI